MRNSCLVSFIVPSLNQGDFIKRCLDSCLQQKIENWEILVQDGGSTDQTLDILAQYGHKISVVSKHDKGQSDAINQAIARANGEIIAWINSDDYYPDDTVLQTVCEAFEQNEGLDIVYGDGMFVDAKKRALRRFQGFHFRDPRKTLIRHPTSPIAQPAVFFRRDLFLNVGGLRDDLHWAMDHELWFRLFMEARESEYIPQCFAHQTLHEDAKSVRGLSEQVREIHSFKMEYLKSNEGRWIERMQVRFGTMKMAVYRMALQTGLVRLLWKIVDRKG